MKKRKIKSCNKLASGRTGELKPVDYRFIEELTKNAEVTPEYLKECEEIHRKKTLENQRAKKQVAGSRRASPKNMNNISIVWDFDKTLTRVDSKNEDSTTKLIKVFLPEGSSMKKFWTCVNGISRTKSKKSMDSISTSDAPAWMYILSRFSKDTKGNLIGLDKRDIPKLISKKIKDGDIALYPNVLNFLQKIKDLSKDRLYQENNIEIHHFIITAGLEDLVSVVFEYHDPLGLIKKIFGCKYFTYRTNHRQVKVKENIPVYCMDKTTKVRALFEICKGCFLDGGEYRDWLDLKNQAKRLSQKPENSNKLSKLDDLVPAVDDLVPEEKKWSPFENMIYIGDGDTDIPAFSLVQSRKGMTIGVFDPSLPKKERDKKAENMRKGKRIDLFTPACFEKDGELYRFIEMRCRQIAKRYEARIKESS